LGLILKLDFQNYISWWIRC